MLGWLFASESDRRLLPGGRRGPTPLIIAIMTFAMLLVSAAGLALANAAGLIEQGVAARYAVQLPGSDLPRALRMLRSTPGVTAATPVPEAEMRRTLERWLGPAGASADLPVPAMITLDLAAGTDPARIAASLARGVPDARLSAHRATLAPLLRSLRLINLLALALVVLLGAASAAAVVLAARGALDTHRATIEVMHGIGATDLQVTHLFQRKIALDAAAGALAGGLAAALALLLIGGGGAALAGELVGGPPLHLPDLAILALVPILLVALATGVARAAVLAALRQAI
jgi:cell division transport system permease protein